MAQSHLQSSKVGHAKFQKTAATKSADHPAETASSEALEAALPASGPPM